MSPEVPLVVEYNIPDLGQIQYFLAPKIDESDSWAVLSLHTHWICSFTLYTNLSFLHLLGDILISYFIFSYKLIFFYKQSPIWVLVFLS